MSHSMWKTPRVSLATVVLLIGCCVGIAQASVANTHFGRATLATAKAGTARSRPRLLKEDFSARFAVRPATVIPTGDGSIVIGKLGKRGHHIHWHVWNASKAYGVATVWVDNGIPTVAQGTFHGFGGTVSAYRVRNGRFTRLTVHYRKAGKLKTWALSLEHLGKPGWTWHSR
jgi:hypothetical protein